MIEFVKSYGYAFEPEGTAFLFPSSNAEHILRLPFHVQHTHE